MDYKLHLVINNKGEIIAIKITKANSNDLASADSINKGPESKLFDDEAYSKICLLYFTLETYAYLQGFAKTCKIIYLSLKIKLICEKGR